MTVTVQEERSLALAVLVRHTAITGVAGVISGVIVGGLGGRIVMRVAAIAGPDRLTRIATEKWQPDRWHHRGRHAGAGHVVGIFSGIFGAIAYVMTEPWLRWAGWAHGPIFGIVLLLTAGHTVLNPENIDFPILRNLELNVAMFGALFVGFGVVLVWVRALVDARTEPVVSTDDAMFGLGIGLVGLGALFTVVLFAQFFVEDTCGCEPAPAIGGFVLLMGGDARRLGVVAGLA